MRDRRKRGGEINIDQDLQRCDRTIEGRDRDQWKEFFQHDPHRFRTERNWGDLSGV